MAGNIVVVLAIRQCTAERKMAEPAPECRAFLSGHPSYWECSAENSK